MQELTEEKDQHVERLRREYERVQEVEQTWTGKYNALRDRLFQVYHPWLVRLQSSAA